MRVARIPTPARSSSPPCVGVGRDPPGARGTPPREAQGRQKREPGGWAERCGGGERGGGEPIGVAAGEALRLIVIDDDEDEGPSAAGRTAEASDEAAASEPAPA